MLGALGAGWDEVEEAEAEELNLEAMEDADEDEEWEGV